jgi:hypothetical protein
MVAALLAGVGLFALGEPPPPPPQAASASATEKGRSFALCFSKGFIVDTLG